MLKGKRVVITRAEHQTQGIIDLLQQHDAIPLLYPAIAIVPPEDTSELDNALKDVATGVFDWLIVTSTNTVYILQKRIEQLGISLENVPTAVVGPTTADTARKMLKVDVKVVPDEYIAEGIVDIFNQLPRSKILLPQANIAKSTLAQKLNHDVTIIDAYQTIVGSGGVDLPSILRTVDAITFTSSSTVTNFLKRMNNIQIKDICVACIGPKTAQTATELGLPVHVVPKDYTTKGLIDALEREL